MLFRSELDASKLLVWVPSSSLSQGWINRTHLQMRSPATSDKGSQPTGVTELKVQVMDVQPILEVPKGM